MTKIIDSFEIESFRGIKNLTLNNLKEINIITGDNNSGKTSVLENINYLSGLDSLRNLAFFSSKNRVYSPRSELSIFEGIKYLFSVDDENQDIRYSFSVGGRKTRVVITKKSYFELLPESQIYDFNLNRDSNHDEMVNVENIELDFIINEKIVKNVNISEFGMMEKDPILEKVSDTVFVTPFRHTLNDIYLTDVLNNVELYQEMLEILKEFDEEIIEINADTIGHSRFKKRYMILSKNHKEAIPFELYGDGMKKTILLMSAVIAAKNGILLLDEFETTIHTLAMDKIFAWILNTCMKLNVQLFITSHSKEVIEKVLKCCPNLQNNINLYTLYKRNEGTKVRILSCEEAIDAIDKYDLEVR